MTASFRSSPPFPEAARKALADSQLRHNLARATSTIRARRASVVSELEDFEQLRVAAAGIKDQVLDNLDGLLAELETNFVARGGQVHHAADAAEANRIIVELVKATGEDEVVKVKSMTTAETELNAALEDEGITVAETDLAELIVQLGDDLPSHIVVPAIHRNRSQIRTTFLEHMGEHGRPAPSGLSDEPADLAGAARLHLRERFLRAKVAISGANFAVAASGSLVVVESEGNGRMCLTLPRTLISLVGVEKVIPSFGDLEVFLALLARSATGERMNPYTSIWSGPLPGDGPQEVHLVLLDNGRTKALADPLGRQALRCIRCAACLNVCPVYERTGGHAYGSVYPGPIGAVLTPQLDNVASDAVAQSLPFASTLCGACYEVCPVRIDIPRLLIHLRAKVVEEHGQTPEAAAMALAGLALGGQRRLRMVESGTALLGRVLAPRRLIRHLPPPLSAWTAARDAPVPATVPFRLWWKRSGRPLDRSRPRVVADAQRAARGLLRRRKPGPPAATAPAEPVRDYLRAGEVVVDDALELFVTRLRAYKARVTPVVGDDPGPAIVAALNRRESGLVAVPDGLRMEWLAGYQSGSVVVDNGLSAQELDAVDSAVTCCTLGIATTGTVVLEAGRPGQGRRMLSLIPDHHVVVIRAGDVVVALPDAIARLDPTSIQTWVSGPSATSDIELHRVEGVHGPRALDVVVYDVLPASELGLLSPAAT